MSRFVLHPVTDMDLMLSTRTYYCEGCGSKLHLDLDWEDEQEPLKELTIPGTIQR